MNNLIFERNKLMKDMISQIIEMDKKAREATEELRKAGARIDQEIAVLKEKIREKYLKTAREKIEKSKILEQKKADAALRKILSSQKKISEDMDKIYLENGKSWVSEICRRVCDAK
jgi:ribosomal protein L4